MHDTLTCKIPITITGATRGEVRLGQAPIFRPDERLTDRAHGATP
jgi:hypothetical protein